MTHKQALNNLTTAASRGRLPNPTPHDRAIAHLTDALLLAVPKLLPYDVLGLVALIGLAERDLAAARVAVRDIVLADAYLPPSPEPTEN